MSAKFYICRHCGNLVGVIHDSGAPAYALLYRDGLMPYAETVLGSRKLLLAGLLFSTAYLVDATYNPFLYFRF